MIFLAKLQHLYAMCFWSQFKASIQSTASEANSLLNIPEKYNRETYPATVMKNSPSRGI